MIQRVMTYEMSSKAFKVLLINSILAGAFLALVLPMYPALATWTRSHKSFELGFGRYLVGAWLGAVVAPVILYLL